MIRSFFGKFSAVCFFGIGFVILDSIFIDKTHRIGYYCNTIGEINHRVVELAMTGGKQMSKTTFSVRMDSDLKKQFDEFCQQVGMNSSTAFNMFARAVLRERRLPFDVTTEADVFYSESNMEHLRRGIIALNSGKGIEHDIIEVSE